MKKSVATIESLDQRFDQLIIKLDQKFGIIDQRFDTLEQKVGGLEQKFGGLEQKVGGLEQKFGGLGRKVDDNTIFIKSLMQKVDENTLAINDNSSFIQHLIGNALMRDELQPILDHVITQSESRMISHMEGFIRRHITMEEEVLIHSHKIGIIEQALGLPNAM